MTPAQKEVVRVCIVDDHAVVREGLAALLNAAPDVQVVGRCGSVEETLRLLSCEPVDLILLDLKLEGESGLDLIRELPTTPFQGRIVVLAAVIHDEEVYPLASHGIAGIFLKSSSPRLLLKCIRKVMAGELWFDQRQIQRILSDSVARQETRKRITERERAVLELVLQGLTNKEIASRLKLKESSVKGTLQSLFKKTGVRTRSQLVRVALEHELLVISG